MIAMTRLRLLTPLLLALLCGTTTSAQPQLPPLAMPVLTGDAEEVRRLLDAGADPNTVVGGLNPAAAPGAAEQEGETPPPGMPVLSYALMHGKSKIAAVLIDAGADVEGALSGLDGYFEMTYSQMGAGVEGGTPQGMEAIMRMSQNTMRQQALQTLQDAGYSLADVSEGKTKMRVVVEEARATLQAPLGNDHPDLAALAAIHERLLDPQDPATDVRPQLLRVLEIQEIALGPDHPGVAAKMRALRGRLGAEVTPRPSMEAALREAIADPALRETADIDWDAAEQLLRAAELQQQGDSERAAPLLEELLRENPELWDDTDAGSREMVSLIVEAQRGSRQAMDSLMAQMFSDSEDVSGAPSNRAPDGAGGATLGTSEAAMAWMAPFSQGRYAEARDVLEHNLRALEAERAPNDSTLLVTLAGLAQTTVALGDYQAARPYLERLLELAPSSDAAKLAPARALLGRVLRVLGERERARSLLEQAVPALEAAASVSRPEPGIPAMRFPTPGRMMSAEDAMTELAEIYVEDGDYLRARPLLERVLADDERRRGLRYRTTADVLVDIAVAEVAVASRDGNCNGARDRLLTALREQDGEDDGGVTPLRFRLTQRLLARDALLSLDCGPLSPADHATLAQLKALPLRELRRQQTLARLTDRPEHADQARAYREARLAVAAWYSQIEDHPLNRWQATYDSLTHVKEGVERQLWYALDESRPHEAAPAPSAALAPGEALVDIHRYSSTGSSGVTQYAAFVVTPTSVTRLDLGPAASIDSSVDAWRLEVLGPNGQPGLNGAAYESLIDRLWIPIADALPTSVERVWISPDAHLALVPWPALSQALPDTDSLALAVLDAPTELGRRTGDARSPSGSSPVDVLLVGDVAFGEGRPFVPLENTGASTAEIADLARSAGGDVVRLTGREASTAAVAERLQRTGYAHLATHGYFAQTRSSDAPGARYLSGRNPLVESGLAFAGANEGPEGTLSAEELVGLDLSGLELAVLSACDTGRGRSNAGEGVMGLRASLLTAGARSVLMSLWPVPDESTKLLMVEFYRQLWEEGEPPVAALRKAQYHVRAQGYDLPVHWAGWTLAGHPW